jgi:hypothetical protein
LGTLPSYFTMGGMGCRSLPSTNFMQRYKNLLKRNILSKTISNSFLFMNRQIWTNQQSHLSKINAEEQASILCALCDKIEIMHLLLACARCSQPLWELVGEAITALIRQASLTVKGLKRFTNTSFWDIIKHF